MVQGSQQRLLELPPVTWRKFGQNIPAAGGGYFRLFPPAIMRAVTRCTKSGASAGTTGRLSMPVTTLGTVSSCSLDAARSTAAMFAFKTYAAAMLSGTLVTIAGFVPIGFAQSSAGEYTFTLFAVVGIALLVSWLVAVIFAPLLSLFILKVPEPGPPPAPPRVVLWYRSFLAVALKARWLTILVTLGLFVGSILLLPLVPRHERCPQPLPMSAGDLDGPAEGDSQHAFAGLAGLLRKTPGQPD